MIWIVGSIAIIIMDSIGLLFPSVKAFEGRYFPYVGIPLTGSLTIAAALIFTKVVLFGIAYGWDMAGLSMNHSIHVSPGSLAQKTEPYTIEPDASWDVWISHIKIHERTETFAVVASFIGEAIEEQGLTAR